jgi:hypothetical protein
MRRAVAVAAIIAAFFVSSAFGDGAKPSFACKAAGRMFRCTASNVDGLHPQWTLRKRGGDFTAWGQSFAYYAPKRWSPIEMYVQTDEKEAWLVRGGEVKLWRGKAVFRCIPNAACGKGPK